MRRTVAWTTFSLRRSEVARTDLGVPVRNVFLSFVGAALVLVSALPASSVAADAPTRLSEVGELALDPSVSVGDGGHAAVAWSRRLDSSTSHLYVRRRDAAGQWGPREKVSTPQRFPYGRPVPDADGAYSPSVAVDASGNTLVTWASSTWTGPYSSASAIFEAYAPVGEPFGPQQIIGVDGTGSSGGERPYTGFTPGGEAVTVWQEMDDQIHFTVMDRGGAFLPQGVIAEAVPGDNAGQPTVRFGRDGTVLVAWTDEAGSRTQGWKRRALVAIRRPGRGFGPAQVLQTATNSTFSLVGGVADDGSALVSIQEVPQSTRVPRHHLATLAAGAMSFAEPREADATPGTMPVEMAFSDAGRGYVLGGYGPTWAQTATTTGVLGPRVPVSPRGADGTGLIATFDRGGALHAAWRDTLNETVGEFRAQTSMLAEPAVGDFEATVVQDSDVVVMRPALSAGRAGDALAVWVTGWYGMGDLWVQRASAVSPSPAVTPGPGPTATPTERPTATPAPVPSATPGPVPSATPGTEPTATPLATPKVAPAPSPSAIVSPSASPTPAPTTRSVPTAPSPAPSSTALDAATARPPSSTAPSAIAAGPPSVAAGGTARRWCRIPDVRGKALAQARREVRQSGCAVGRVGRARGGRGVVVRQSTPGSVRQVGFLVVLVVDGR